MALGSVTLGRLPLVVAVHAGGADRARTFLRAAGAAHIIQTMPIVKEHHAGL